MEDIQDIQEELQKVIAEEPGNDRLNLDESARRRSILPTHTNLNFFGFAEIGDDNENFSELSSREGLLQNSLANFDPNEFSIQGEPSMIDENGVFEVDWTEEMDNFDLLISTIIKPDTATDKGDFPNSETIARKMYEGNYYSYFINNIKNEVSSYNDEEIKALIKTKYCVSQYLNDKEKPKKLVVF